MEVRVIEEAHRSEKMIAFAFVCAALFVSITTHGADFDAFAVFDDFLGAEVGPLAVAAEDVVEGDRHLQRLVAIIEVTAGFGVFVIVVLLHPHLAGFRVESVKPQAAIEEAGMPGDAAHEAVFTKTLPCTGHTLSIISQAPWLSMTGAAWKRQMSAPSVARTQ